MPKRKLTKAEIALLSKGLRFVPTGNHINKAKLKMELEAYGRMLRLKWHFRNDEKAFDQNKFKPKSTFNPRNKDAAIETYLSSLGEKLMHILLGKSGVHFLNLQNDKNIAIKSADKGSTVVVWDRDDYIKEAPPRLKLTFPW